MSSSWSLQRVRSSAGRQRLICLCSRENQANLVLHMIWRRIIWTRRFRSAMTKSEINRQALAWVLDIRCDTICKIKNLLSLLLHSLRPVRMHLSHRPCKVWQPIVTKEAICIVGLEPLFHLTANIQPLTGRLRIECKAKVRSFRPSVHLETALPKALLPQYQLKQAIRLQAP